MKDGRDRERMIYTSSKENDMNDGCRKQRHESSNYALPAPYENESFIRKTCPVKTANK